MGLLNDFSEGVTGLIKYGNVGGLIRNVTHGVSNSAAKVTIMILKFAKRISKSSQETGKIELLAIFKLLYALLRKNCI